jgi:uroporphyrinogen decarboxylase
MKNGMTSRERVLAALNHQEPDRVPIDFGSNYNTSVNVIAYNRLKKHLGITSPTYMRYIIPMLAAVDLDEGREVMNMMGGDVLPLPRYHVDGLLTKDWKPWELKDGSIAMVPGRFDPAIKEDGATELVFRGITQFRMPKGGYYFDRVFNPLAGVENRQQLQELLSIFRAPGGGGLRDDEAEILKSWAKTAYEETDYALLGDTYGFSIYHLGLEAFGYNKYFTMMAAEPDMVHTFMTAIIEEDEKFFADYLKAVGPYLVAVIMGDDYGTQRAPMISVKMFRELFKPYLARICKFIHDTSPHVKVLLHSCGAVKPLIPEFIEAGVDALNPVQTTAEGMDPATLKREFGKDIVFWGGGVRCQTTLANGSVDDVRREVKELVETWKPGGGYVFCPDHDIQENVPPERILATYQAAQEYGRY